MIYVMEMERNRCCYLCPNQQNCRNQQPWKPCDCWHTCKDLKGKCNECLDKHPIIWQKCQCKNNSISKRLCCCLCFNKENCYNRSLYSNCNFWLICNQLQCEKCKQYCLNFWSNCSYSKNAKATITPKNKILVDTVAKNTINRTPIKQQKDYLTSSKTMEQFDTKQKSSTSVKSINKLLIPSSILDKFINELNKLIYENDVYKWKSKLEGITGIEISLIEYNDSRRLWKRTGLARTPELACASLGNYNKIIIFPSSNAVNFNSVHICEWYEISGIGSNYMIKQLAMADYVGNAEFARGQNPKGLISAN